jgi:transcriptional regulator with GAF, ATPase, and Fis domain
VEPIPETARAIADFGPFIIENEDLLRELMDKAHRVQALVPQCRGVSVASNADEVTFTLVATAKEIALLDAVQYIGGGPCVDAVRAERVLAYEQSQLLSEEEWQLFAHATAAASVASTLTLPVIVSGQVGGSVNLYASTPDAFDGHHEALARIFDAWAPGAVTNADLPFSTRHVAERAPDLLRDDVDLAIASSVIANLDNLSIEDGRQRLRDAAQRAGVTEEQLAHTIIELHRIQDTE